MKTSSLIITALGVAVSANALAEDTNWINNIKMYKINYIIGQMALTIG